MKNPFHRQDGFTMIEVLVAVLVLAIGLLGVAGVQLLSMQQTTNSNVRSQATLYAQDLAERMRANGGAILTNTEIDRVEALLQRDLGTAAEIDIVVNAGVAEIEIQWEERDSFAVEGRSEHKFKMQARL